MFCRENVIIPDASLFSVRSHSCNLFQCLSYFSKLVCIGKRSNDRQTDTPPNHLDHLWKFHLCKHTHSYKERERWEIMKYKLFCITFYLLQIFILKTSKSKYIDYNWVKLLKDTFVSLTACCLKLNEGRPIPSACLFYSLFLFSVLGISSHLVRAQKKRKETSRI